MVFLFRCCDEIDAIWFFSKNKLILVAAFIMCKLFLQFFERNVTRPVYSLRLVKSTSLNLCRS
jgi:hypothetical protein